MAKKKEPKRCSYCKGELAEIPKKDYLRCLDCKRVFSIHGIPTRFYAPYGDRLLEDAFFVSGRVLTLSSMIVLAEAFIEMQKGLEKGSHVLEKNNL